MSAPYRPGQSPWPDNQPQRPDRPPPIQFREEPAPSGSSGLDWALRIVGLVAVAVLSGFAWWFFNNEPPEGSTTGFGDGSPSTQQRAGEYEFTSEVDRPVVDDDCGEHAYGQIQDFLRRTPCEELIRAVYTTTIDTRTVYTSVSVVEMADDAKARQLRGLTDTDNTGNVNDLVREGKVKVKGLDTLSAGGGYDSSRSDRDVIIVESDYDPAASEGGTEGELDRVCSDALRLAEEMVDTAG